MPEPEVRTPVSAYVLAAVSFVFVTGGIYFVMLGAIVVFARSTSSLPPLVWGMILIVGWLSGPIAGGS